MNSFNKYLFESLLYSAVSQLDRDFSAKQALIRQISSLLNNNNNECNNNETNVESIDNTIDLNDNSLIEKYESMSRLYEKCFEVNFNSTKSEINISINEKSNCALDSRPELSSSVESISNLVIDYATNGRYEVAIPLCKQKLEDVRQHILDSGTEHRQSDECHLSELLAFMHLERREFTESEQYLRQALDLWLKCFNANDRNVIKIKTYLSIVLYEEKRHKESELMSKQVLCSIHENELGFDVNRQLCVWELAEEMQVLGHKDYALVASDDDYRHWYRYYGKYPQVLTVFKNLSDIYRNNDKPIAAEVVAELSLDLKPDIIGSNDSVFGKMFNQTKRSPPHLLRRNTIPSVTDSIGCQTEERDVKIENIVLKPKLVINNDKNYLFKNKLFTALGLNNKV